MDRVISLNLGTRDIAFHIKSNAAKGDANRA
jgi:uncharacterized protein YggU (UPF0235/DUF167 family)